MRKLLLIEKKMNDEIIMSIRQGAFNTKHSAFTTGETRGTTP